MNEAEEERLRSEREHMRVTHACQEAEARVQMLQKSLKRVIVKSKPYFELKAQFNHILEVMPTQAFVKPSALTRCSVHCTLFCHSQFPILSRQMQSFSCVVNVLQVTGR